MPDDLTELVDQLRLIGADTQSTEVKSGVGKSVLETLSAFSNGQGGRLIVGLSELDGFTPVPGFDAVRARNALSSRCAQLTPVVRPDLRIEEFEGNQLLIADISELLPRDKPCYITDRGQYHGSFLRTGDGDVRLQQYEIDRLIEEHAQPTWDTHAVPGAFLADLDQEALTAFCDSQEAIRPRTFSDGTQTALVRLGVMDLAQSPTMAALLAMGAYPQQFFPRLSLTFAVFPGTTKGEIGTGLRLLDSASLSGPIPELVSEALRLVRKNMRLGAQIGNIYRAELPDYPLVAVREALVNALMHRDYSPLAVGTPVQLNMFVDRLEVLSPGGLYGTVTMRTLGQAGLSSTRNQRLATLLESVALPGGGLVAENRGTGFAVMSAELAKALLPPIDARDDLASFSVTFHRRRVAPQERYRSARDAILSALDERNSVSASEVTAESQFSRSAITQAMNQLIEDGLVEATEPARSPKQRYRRSVR